jgi:hypothetical protein
VERRGLAVFSEIIMPVDLACPNCREPVQVEEHAPLCPRCGTDLQDTRLTETAAQQNEEAVGEDDFAGLHVVDSGAQPPDFSALSAETDRPAQENPVSMAPASDPDAGRDRPLSDFTTPETAPAEPLVESAVESAAEPAKIVRDSAAGAPAVSRRLYFIVLTYAILATLLLAGHLVLLRTRGPHQLESLPDIVPNYRDTLPDLEPTLNKQGQVIRQIVPRDALLPPGHTLALGQSQRFGNVRVTPLKVTREMLQFAHYSGDAARTRSAEGPVLKLWLKFENLSEDQVFAPLDRELLYFRGRTSADSFELRANNFLVGRDNPRQPVLVYDLALDGEWDPQGQSLGTFASPRLLEPGAERVTYVPTQPEGIEDLQGDLVWRVHIRKGYHPESGRGVTTLIDIAFHSSEIETQG